MSFLEQEYSDTQEKDQILAFATENLDAHSAHFLTTSSPEATLDE